RGATARAPAAGTALVADRRASDLLGSQPFILGAIRGGHVIHRLRSAALATAASVLSLALPLSAAIPSPPPPAKEKPKTLSDLLGGMAFRSIGPYRGGRATAVTGVRHDPLTYYFGGSGGGVWKTTDGGANWEPMSDKDFKTGSVGAIAVSESDPNVVYVGMGEAPIRGNVSHGDGVWKSTDG